MSESKPGPDGAGGAPAERIYHLTTQGDWAAATATVALASGLFSGASGATAAPASTDSQTYIVLYNQMAVPSDASSSVARAGGRLVQAYNEIGVAIASSAKAPLPISARTRSPPFPG